ncbi:MAG: YfdX family protein [Methylovulum sp.]|nr:YfdX family protein [Methylovulum sp.]
MNKIQKNSQDIALMLLVCGQFSLPVLADNLPSPPKNALAQAKILAVQEQKIVEEAPEIIAATQKALDAIENKDIKKALAILQEAASELDVILAKYPNMALVSADIDTNVVEFDGSADTAKKAIDAADDFLDNGNVQYARQILDELISEARVTTTSIPLKTYPLAIKQSIASLSSGKANEAAGTLYKALHTLDITTEIIPLPVLNAEILLTEASEIEHKQGLSQGQNRTEVSGLADAATDQLKLAQLLGYGDKADYKDLYAAIDDFKEALFSEKSSAMWSTVKQHLTNLKNKLTFFKQ